MPSYLPYYTAGVHFDSYNSHVVRGVPHCPARNSVVFNSHRLDPAHLASIGYILLDLYITFPLYIYILYLQRKHNGGNSLPNFEGPRSPGLSTALCLSPNNLHSSHIHLTDVSLLSVRVHSSPIVPTPVSCSSFDLVTEVVVYSTLVLLSSEPLVRISLSQAQMKGTPKLIRKKLL
jgi:hypothetical protein